MNFNNSTHPVYVKRGATSPHNYNAQRRTAADNHRSYAVKARKQEHEDKLREAIARENRLRKLLGI